MDTTADQRHELHLPGGKRILFHFPPDGDGTGLITIERVSSSNEQDRDETSTTTEKTPQKHLTFRHGNPTTQWFPLVPRGATDEPGSWRESGSSGYSIEALPPGTFDKELGGAGGHGTTGGLSFLDMVIFPGDYACREVFPAGETKEGYLAHIPNMLQSFAEYMGRNPEYDKHDIKDVAGRCMEYLLVFLSLI